MIRIDIAPPQQPQAQAPANNRQRGCGPLSEATMKSLTKVGTISALILMGTFAYTLLGPKDTEMSVLITSFGITAGVCGTLALAAGIVYNNLVR